jgi:hypothetical protein
MITLWHYAPACHLDRIGETGHLRPSNAGAPAELPLLWFSANQVWEPTAAKMVRDVAGCVRTLTHLEMRKLGIVRFGIASTDSRLFSWKSACNLAGTPRDMRRTLERVGIKSGAHPQHWFATPAPMPLDELTLQIWDGGWKAIDYREFECGTTL